MLTNSTASNMNSTAENITFMVIKGIIALVMSGIAFYCIIKGIEFFRLTQAEAEQIHMHFLGLDIDANGCGAVIFAVGIGLCWIAKLTAPTRIASTTTTNSSTNPSNATDVTKISSTELKIQEKIDSPSPTPSSNSVNSIKEIAITKGVNIPPSRFD